MLETKVESSADANPQETSEWLESLDSVVEEGGSERASFLLRRLIDHAALYGIQTPHKLTTPYINTIPVEEEVPYPGDRAIERRIKSLIRWNAMAMVVRANKHDPGHRRPHFHLRLARHAHRSRPQSFLSTASTAISPATSFISRATPRPESTRARSSKDASRKSIWKISATSCALSPACPPIRIPG